MSNPTPRTTLAHLELVRRLVADVRAHLPAGGPDPSPLQDDLTMALDALDHAIAEVDLLLTASAIAIATRDHCDPEAVVADFRRRMS
jgi:hypothetical protein